MFRSLILAATLLATPAAAGDLTPNAAGEVLDQIGKGLDTYIFPDVARRAKRQIFMKDGLIAEYHESVNGGVAHAQLGLAPERMAKVMGRWAKRLRDRDDVETYRAAVRARYAAAR